ncbi:MAG: hypothetical protein Fur0022_21220 [Anaerolineales bacterium]
MKISSWPKKFFFFLALILLAFLLAWVSTGFEGVTGWESFWAVCALGIGILWAGLRSLRAESLPGWVTRLTVAAALIRLGAGALWFAGLPVWGHDTEVQNAGYVMSDAFQRDAAAWELAQADKPLTRAFSGYRAADQYGGLLFLSAAVYRFLGGDVHQPLQMVVLMAAISALAVPFTWAFARRLFDDEVAKWAAWGVALYPEAILLGSSQMREALMMTFAGMAFYGLARYWGEGSGAGGIAAPRTLRLRVSPHTSQSLVSAQPSAQGASSFWGLGFVLLALALTLPFSPPLAVILLVMLGIVGLGMDDWRIVRNWRLWAVLGGAALVAVTAIGLGWERIAAMVDAERFETPWEMVAYWVEISARWQARMTAGSSGVLQSVFDRTPEAVHLPFLLAYGVARPLLPAELLYSTVPMWWAIGVWRSLGWTILLGMLVYAPVRAVNAERGEQRNMLLGLSLAAWASILIATFWGGGDQWDNPRYRVAFCCVQIALAAWAGVAYRRAPDAWMRRAVAGVGIILAWFVPWYLDRYTDFDVIVGFRAPGVLESLGLGVGTWILYVAWDVVKTQKKKA